MRFQKQTGSELVIEAALLVCGTAAIAVLHDHAVLLSGALLVLAVAVMWVWRRKSVVVYLVGAVAGPGAEVFGVRAGAWKYATPAFFGIPLWLPFAWGYAVVLVVWIAETAGRMAAE